MVLAFVAVLQHLFHWATLLSRSIVPSMDAVTWGGIDPIVTFTNIQYDAKSLAPVQNHDNTQYDARIKKFNTLSTQLPQHCRADTRQYILPLLVNEIHSLFLLDKDLNLLKKSSFFSFSLSFKSLSIGIVAWEESRSWSYSNCMF